MKRLFTGLAVLCVLFAPGLTMAATVSSGEEYSLPATETVEDNIYIGAANAVVSGTVNGDVFIGASNAVVSGTVRDDVTIGAGNVHVLGDVGGDVRVAGGTVTIAGAVAGEVMVAGGMVYVVDGASVGGDLYIAGGEITMDGDVGGKVHIAGGDVDLNGQIGGDVVAMVEELSFGETAIVNGNVRYEAQVEAFVAEGASLLGGLEFTEVTYGEAFDGIQFQGPGPDVVFALATLFKFFGLIILLVAVLAVVLLLPNASKEVVTQSYKNFWPEVLRGLLVFVLTPMIVLFLLVTVLGSFVGLMVGALFGLLLLLSKVFAAILLGAMVWHALSKKGKKHALQVTWPAAVLGAVLIQLIGLIPIAGWIFNALLYLAALGTMSMMLHQHFWPKKR